ncbi:MAG: amino acid permease [Blastocatellia bacterium]|nr:amino acid permease [Blastocatellia bacterium]
MSQTTQAGLVRGIRRWDLVAVAINGIIGAGIFGLPSKVYALIGSYSLLAFLVCALVVTLIILCFAEVGSRYSGTGGPYLYAHAAFGPVVGFEVGWLMWLARLTAFAANCNLLIEYIGFFRPAVNSGLWRAGAITLVVVAITAVNIAGVRDAAIVSNIFTIGKLIPIMLFIAVGLFFIEPQNFSFAARPGYTDFSKSVLLLIYAFTGFEMAVIPAGEVRNPQRNLPVAILTAIGLVALIYILVQVVSIGTLPGMADSERPLADASSMFLGAAGASIISAGALVSIIGNLNVIMLAGSRLPFAMAERGELPSFLSATHARFHTPHLSILAMGAVVLVLTLSGSFIYAATVSVIARLLAYGSTCAALIVLRGEKNAPEAAFKVPGGVGVSIATLLLAGWLLSNSTWSEARDTVIAALLGLLIYLACRLWQRKATREQLVQPAVPPVLDATPEERDL